jgi:hypothetical protein
MTWPPGGLHSLLVDLSTLSVLAQKLRQSETISTSVNVWSSDLPPGVHVLEWVHEGNSGGTQKRKNLQQVLKLALMKILSRTEALACQKQAQSSH